MTVTTKTQKQLLLGALEKGPVCSFEFYYNHDLTHRIAARIHDLKRDGIQITSGRCERHDHNAHAIEWRLA